MSASLAIYFQVSCFLMQNVVSQYPTMFGMPGMPQIIPYQSSVQQYYDTTYHSKHKHKSKRTSKKNKGHRRHIHRRASSSESSSRSSESEANSGEECSCDINCNQCAIEIIPSCCDMFCGSCINQGFLIVPYPYPVAMPTELTPTTQEPDVQISEKDETDQTDITLNDGRRSGISIQKSTEKPKEIPKDKSKQTTKKPLIKETESTEEKLDKVSKDNTVQSEKEKSVKNSTEKSAQISKLHEKHIEITLKRKIKGKRGKQKNENEIDANSLQGILDTPKTSDLHGQEIKDIIFKVPNNGNAKYVLTSMRRVKENWLPKYGIVPIPEKVATNLMSRLRSLKSIQPVRETQTISDEEASKNSVQTVVVREPGKTNDSQNAKTEVPSLPQRLETILVRDSGSGITIEGTKSAVQSLNRRLLDAIVSEKSKTKSDSLPIELVKKIYQY